jgi:hypothetical protein
MAYQKGEVRTTEITQQQEGVQVRVTIGAVTGNYAGALEARDTFVWLYTRDQGDPEDVIFNGEQLPKIPDLSALYQVERGWTSTKPGLVIAKTGRLPVSAAKEWRPSPAAVNPGWIQVLDATFARPNSGSQFDRLARYRRFSPACGHRHR